MKEVVRAELPLLCVFQFECGACVAHLDRWVDEGRFGWRGAVEVDVGGNVADFRLGQDGGKVAVISAKILCREGGGYLRHLRFE